MSVGTIPVTAIILTMNEEANIAECLSCLARIDDVVLVDSGSTDGTLEAARKACNSVRIFSHPFKDFGDQRNWALENTKPHHDWVLFVDADEFCGDDFIDELETFVANPGDAVGAFIAGRNYFLGRWLKHTTFYPSYQFRLLKLNEAKFIKHGHGQREVVSGPTVKFENGWRHEAFSKGVHEWVERHNRYSSEEAGFLSDLSQVPLNWKELFGSDQRARRRFLKHFSAKLPFRPLFTFIYMYLIKRGFMDGYAGWVYCLLMASHHVHILAKRAELRRSRDGSFKPEP